MKTALLVLTLVFANAALADRTEVVDLNPYQKVFELPLDSRNYNIKYLTPKKVATEITTVTADNCDQSFDETPGRCESSKAKYENAYQVEIEYQSYSQMDMETMSTTQTIEVNFAASEMPVGVLSQLPEIKLFGRGLSANHKFAKNVVALDVKDVTAPELVVDEANSEYCDRTAETPDYTCTDKLVYKTAPVTRRYLTVSIL